jgi:nucleoside-diphosphate-sugar epimerase
MKVVITGGAGFLGKRLTGALLRRGALRGPDGGPDEGDNAIDRITLVDVVAPPDFADPRVVAVTGDIADPDVLASAITADTASIFHLAAVVSGMAETDFDLGMRINIDATRRLLDACRGDAGRTDRARAGPRGGLRPRVVFASSIAVYGGDVPDIVPETTAVNPRTSYGAQKAVAELLINDYTRKGFIDGRALRLPTISVRPGRPNAAASSFASGIVREPLNGQEAVCPVDPGTRLWLSSPSTAIDCLIAGHDVPADGLGSNRIVNVPGISLTAGEMVASLSRVAGPEVAGRVRWELDPRIARMVATWPGALDTTRARALGFPGDETFDAIIRRYMDEELGITSPP